MPTFEFIYDFGSPNAYLAHKVIPAVEARLGIKVIYTPALLGGIFKATGNASPMVTLAGIKNKGEYAALETERFIKQHDLAGLYNANTHFPVNTLLMMRMAAATRQQPERYQQLIHCCFDAMWLHGKKMDDPEVVATALTACDLPAESLLAAAAEPENKQALIQLTEAAVQRGVFGSPSFFVGDELFFGKDKLRDAEEAFLIQSGAGSEVTR